MPTGPARRALLTGVRSFPFRNYVPTKGLPVGPGLDPDPRHLPDRHRGDGRGGHRDRLLHRQPVPDRPALRATSGARSTGQAELLAGRLPLPQQAVQAARHAQHDRALPAARAVGHRRGRAACARWPAGTRSTATTSASTRPRAWCAAASTCSTTSRRSARSSSASTPSTRTSRFDAPRVYQLAAGSAEGHRDEQGITPIQPFETPYSWVVDVDLDDESDRARARAVRRRDRRSSTSGSGG